MEWISRADLSVDEVQRFVDGIVNSGFVPIYSKTTAYRDDSLKIDVVVVKPLDVDWQFRRYDEATYETKNREFTSQGYKIVSTQTYQQGGTTYYNVIWHRPRQATRPPAPNR